MEVEEEPQHSPGRTVLLGLGVLMIVGAVLVVALLAIPLQPSIQIPPVAAAPTCGAQIACVSMPPGAGSQQKNFAPGNITVYLGVNNTVMWTNQDTVQHTVKSVSVPQGSGTFSSALIDPGKTFEVTLNVTGVYKYECTVHPAWMQASIVVKNSTAVPKPTTVVIPAGTALSGKLSYTPGTITVVIGVNNTVVWVNQDTTKHTVTANGGSFNSGDILTGQSWSYTFTTPGTYTYHCLYHSWMTGTVVVEAAP